MISLWAVLEKKFGHRKHEQPGDYSRQGWFTLFCVIVAFIIDIFTLENLVASYSPRVIPLPFYQLILLPLIMYIGAMIVGPSAELRIAKSKLLNKRRTK